MIRARVLCLSNPSDAVAELSPFKPSMPVVDAVSNRVLRIDVGSDAARIICDAYARAGVCVPTAPNADGSVRLILNASVATHQSVLSLREDVGDEARIALDAIVSALEAFERGPALPDSSSIPNPRIAELFGSMRRRSLVMGILNVTPDSFSDGGCFVDRSAAVSRALEMVNQGADIIDIGGESTRPGAEPVSAGEEIRRVVPVIRELSETIRVPISVDTWKARVAEAALDAGASIVNDISGASFDPEMPHLIAERRCPAVLMHIKGTPRDMQKDPRYDDLMGEVFAFLQDRLAALQQAGADTALLMIDPGIGFGKTVQHNLQLLRRLSELRSLGRPIVVGTSRKSTIGHVLGGLPPEERLEGTAATVALSIAHGANIVRVHDVKEMVRVARMTDAVVRGESEV